ncbi:MAG: hypothetical protein GY705_26880 [Bacteroidetes bacterium]|nr:hypothetical protein [Bacteroidota bacterium]
MNHLKYIVVLGGLCLFILEWTLFAVRQESENTLVEVVEQVQVGKDEPPYSITFIAGEDEGDNPYYKNAEQYFRSNYTGDFHLLDTECRSLEEIIKRLNTAPKNNKPWKRINIVTHSNDWRGLSLTLRPQEERITVASLTNAFSNDQLPPLGKNIIDEKTEIVFHSCGLGKNEPLLCALRDVFSGNPGKHIPVLRSTLLFNQFGTEQGKAAHSLANYWYAFYPTGYFSGETRISQQLQERYPDAGVNWRKALQHENPRFLEDPYFHRFNIPVEWVVTYANKEERPHLKDKQQIKQWVQEQAELMEVLKQYEIPIEQFRWRVKNTEYQWEDGTKEPAIHLYGKSTVVCILKTLTQPENPYKKWMPEVTDQRFFTSI